MRNAIVALTTVLFFSLSACTSADETPIQLQPPIRNLTPTVTSAPTMTPLPAIEEVSILPGHHAYSFSSSSGEEIRFLLFLPDEYDPTVQWPLIVYFHGAGERGLNIERLVDLSLPELTGTTDGFPFAVVSPQLPSGLWPKYIDPVDELLDHLTDYLAIDENHLYLTGFSIGAHGTWRYALHHPDRFAAIAPISEAPSLSSVEPVPEDICTLKDLPIWVFHSEGDTWTSFELTELAVEALEDCGAEVRFTRYIDLDHVETVYAAYGNPDLFDWFLEHTN